LTFLARGQRMDMYWDKHSIKAEIHRRGATLTQLALDHGLYRSACRGTFLKPCPKADRVISTFLCIPLHELWPDRYDSAGNRLRAKRKSNSIRSRRKSQVATPVTDVTVPRRARMHHHAEEQVA
jgi:Ner family transcriptional regulator